MRDIAKMVPEPLQTSTRHCRRRPRLGRIAQASLGCVDQYRSPSVPANRAVLKIGDQTLSFPAEPSWRLSLDR
jgi:hypothetical protein